MQKAFLYRKILQQFSYKTIEDTNKDNYTFFYEKTRDI